MNAEDIMTQSVTTIGPGATVGQALELMEEHGIRHLPVVSGREVVGMLSDRDLRGFGLTLVTDIEGLDRVKARLGRAVASVMSSNVIAVAPETDLDEVIELFVEEKISAVPVIEEDTNELAGIISVLDVLRALRDRA